MEHLFSIFSLFTALVLYLSSRVAKKNPESLLRQSFFLSKKTFNPEDVKVYMEKLLKVGYSVITFHILFAFAQYLTGNIALKLLGIACPSIFLQIYQIYSLRIFSGKAVSIKKFSCFFAAIMLTVGIAGFFIYTLLGQ